VQSSGNPSVTFRKNFQKESLRNSMVEFQEILQSTKGKSITNNPIKQINLFNHGTLNDKFRRKETLV
jgi:hypothetical protein